MKPQTGIDVSLAPDIWIWRWIGDDNHYDEDDVQDFISALRYLNQSVPKIYQRPQLDIKKTCFVCIDYPTIV